MWPYPQFSADLFTFTEEIRKGKRHFFVVKSAQNIVADFNYFQL